MKIFIVLFFIIVTHFSVAQTLSGVVIDGKTQSPIPFATIITGAGQGLVTNEEGAFSVQLNAIEHPQDSVYISFMGYQKKGFIASKEMDTIVTLEPSEFQLRQVFLSTENLDPKEIIERVKEHLDQNYTVNYLTKKQIFFRQSDFNRMKKVDFGFQKSTIAELNKKLIDSITQLIPRSSSYYKEVAGNFYGNYTTHKLNVDKAAELYDKSKDVSFDGLEQKMERIFKENIKPDSYLKIKSGVFSTKVQLDSITNSNEEAEGIKVEVGKQQDKQAETFQSRITDRISELYEQLFFNPDTKLDILEKSNRYQFTKRDVTFIDTVPVYVLDFEPKGRKDFKGTAYVNTDDFAIVRLEFENVRPLKTFGLFGIKFRENVYRGKMLFAKTTNGVYEPQYLELERGAFFGVNRPLKVIEKNKNVKGRRKQNELSLELDVQTNSLQKYELVVFNSSQINSSDYDNATENKDVKAVHLNKYDPTFWSGYTIMEPNTAIQSFEAVE